MSPDTLPSCPHTILAGVTTRPRAAAAVIHRSFTCRAIERFLMRAPFVSLGPTQCGEPPAGLPPWHDELVVVMPTPTRKGRQIPPQ